MIVTIAGWITIISAAAFFLFVSFTAACHALRRYVETIQKETRHVVSVEIGHRMMSDSWWFSETPVAMKAIAVYGRYIAGCKYESFISIQETWKKELAEYEDDKRKRSEERHLEVPAGAEGKR